jgi:Uncharacterized protein conserved in bacteria
MAQVSQRIVAEVTAYTPSDDECGKHDGITASGTYATEGRTIAMDNSIPFGTKVLIGDTVYIVEDRGGSIKGNHVDIFMNDKDRAQEFGRRQMQIKILEED